MLLYVDNIEKYNFKNSNLCKFYAYFMINDVNNIEKFFSQTNEQTDKYIKIILRNLTK